ncbi:cytochrome C oxidase subunit IV family protein [Seongchinamella unica]|uniref:cytochrome C oxidase subunit IV family protein n=1 Tax=Seongchinamella unica TaxID=2547392 RepID=UPI0014045056|nr:cytochrome C oxidase subunit IV family protein [Seongchinamella unica]
MFTTWLTLVALTLLAMWSAQLDPVSRQSSLPVWGFTLVLLGAAYKVQQILLVYLNLRVSSAGWRGSFLALVWVVMVVVWAAYWASLRGLV